MRLVLRRHSRTIVLQFLFPAALLLAGAAGWEGKPIDAWTPEDARVLLEESPWVRNVVGNIARLPTEAQLREGGNMGERHGVGFDGLDAYETKSSLLAVLLRSPDDPGPPPKPVPLRLSWKSARPVHEAELRAGMVQLPSLPGEGYTLAVYGIPGPHFDATPERLGAPLIGNAVLHRAGKKDVRPTRVGVFQREDGLVVLYRFPPSAEISVKDGWLQFSARIGRIGVAATFDLNAMVYRDRLEI
jgi:hypothetical protein